MMASTLPTHTKFITPILQIPADTFRVTKTTTRLHASSSCSSAPFRLRPTFIPRLCSFRPVFTRACGDGVGSVDTTSQQSTSSSDFEDDSDSYVALFVRMLGLDNDPLEREQAAAALWKYSLRGKEFIDEIMQFRGSLNLTVNLLKSESTSTCEAAAGILRNIAAVNVYRQMVAQSGAIEEIARLLTQPSLDFGVKEQSICVLWNLSVDEELRMKIANSDILLLLIKFLEDGQTKVKEATAGVLANLALSRPNHKIMVEANVIPKLANLLKVNEEGSIPVKKLAKNVLLELAKDEYYKILVMEEGLVLVPLIGKSAYDSFNPPKYPWPALADGTPIKKTWRSPSKYGAGEVLLGLNAGKNRSPLDEAKMNALEGHTRQQFLVCTGAIEKEDANVGSQGITVLPWIDGVARLVLMLGLDDELVISKAAESIADASISEHMRLSFKEAGAVKPLVSLVGHCSDDVRFSAIRALERLSISTEVCKRIEEEGVLSPLINSLKRLEVNESSTDLTLNILARILDPSKEMKSKYFNAPVNDANKQSDEIRVTAAAENVAGSKSDSRNVEDVLDSQFLSRLIETLKMSSPILQRKAASVLEFVTVTNSSSIEKIISLDVQSGLDAVFDQKILNDAGTESEMESQRPELYTLEIEEAGLAISAASRLLTRLLESRKFLESINSSHFTKQLRKILKSRIPLHNKDYVAACLVKLSSMSAPNLDTKFPINEEVTIYETVPRLLEQIKSSFDPEVQEAAVLELNRIISEGAVDSSRAVAAEGGIFALVKLIERGSENAVDAGLAVLYNLSMDIENHSAIVAAGAVPALKRIVLSQKPQWTRALHLLRTLPT